jgi:hypothetical protein
LKQT